MALAGMSTGPALAGEEYDLTKFPGVKSYIVLNKTGSVPFSNELLILSFCGALQKPTRRFLLRGMVLAQVFR